MYAKYGNLLLIDGYMPFNPRMFPRFQDVDYFMEKVHPDYLFRGTQNPLIVGTTWPGFYEDPYSPDLPPGGHRVKVLVRTEIKLELP